MHQNENGLLFLLRVISSLSDHLFLSADSSCFFAFPHLANLKPSYTTLIKLKGEVINRNTIRVELI